MNHSLRDPIRLATQFRILLAAIFVTGCIAGCGGEDDGPEPVGPSVGGKNWSGTYFRSDDRAREQITATVSQKGDALVITTTHSQPEGQRLTGTISPEGKMSLTDAHDGETWTTFYGPASANYIKLADFVERPEPGEPRPPLNVIEIRR